MKLLPGPHGWDSWGELAHVTLELFGGPRPLTPQERYSIVTALWCHSCHPPAFPKILSCLEHSVYQCLMRPGIAREVARCGCIERAGVLVSHVLLGTDSAHSLSQKAPKTPP